MEKDFNLAGWGSGVISLFLIVAAIWIFVEVKRLKHKIIAIGIIILLVFSYFSFYAVFKHQSTDFKTGSGLLDGAKLYFSWLVSVFGNLKTLTSNAVSLDWKADNKTLG